ncbi:MAG: thaumatin family protein [Xanthomonadales bacterium]
MTLLIFITSGLAAQTQTRDVKIINSCAEPLWIASQNLAGGPEWFLGGDSTACTTDAQCQGGDLTPGALCNQNTGHCEIDVQIETDCVSCKIWPRTACKFETGFDCPAGVNCCATGGIKAPEAPVTVVEFTFQSGKEDPSVIKTDFYDISIIDGVNTSASMTPTGVQGTILPDFPSNFWCGNPGGRVSTSTESFNCSWEQVLGEDCGGQPGLRVVEPFFAAGGTMCPGSSTLTSLPIGDVCSCTDDSDCDQGQICGLGNSQVINHKLCGTPGGCTTAKALCGIGQYFSCSLGTSQACGAGGASCSEHNQCTSNFCDEGVCTESPADFLNCREKFPQTVACQMDSDCPGLTGIEFAPGQDCACPAGTECVRINAAGAHGCQMTCNSGACTSMSCTQDADCVRLTDSELACTSNEDCSTALDGSWTCNRFLNPARCQKDTGTFMLCDTLEGSPTSGQCVATKASMVENQGVNGQSCVNPKNFESCDSDADCGGGVGTCNLLTKKCDNKPFNAATNLCAGCSTDSRNPLSILWPNPTDECTASPTDECTANPTEECMDKKTSGDCDTIGCNNSDWVAQIQPLLATFKEACPTTYTFPFGDVTATFQCRSDDTVNDMDYEIVFCPETEINAGHAGAWFNSATSGQGQFIDVEPAKQFMFISWYTYTDAISDNPNEQRWLTAQGNYSGDTAELGLFETLGGRFDDPQAVTTTRIGEVTLNFIDCGQGLMTYSFDEEELEGEFPLLRVIPGSGNVCQELTEITEITTEAVDINAGMDGTWFDPDTPGQGFIIDTHPDPEGGNFIFVSWFTYGEETASGQRWLTAQGSFEGSVAKIDVFETTGGNFDDPQAISTINVGTMSIDFTDCSNAQLTYSLPANGAAGDIAITRLVTGGQALCEELAGAD